MSKQIEMVIVPKSELQILIIDSVHACLKSYKVENKEKPPIDNEGYLTKKQAAKLLNCSIGSIDNYRRAGVIKRYYIGSSVRFKKEELLEVINRSADNKKNR